MKKAVIYARYSSDRQTEQSIEGQLRICNEFATKNGFIIVETFIDRAMTGKNDNRPDFQRMLKNSSLKNWEYVIVYAVDRFGRDDEDYAINKRTLSKSGVSLLSATQITSKNIDGTLNINGILSEGILVSLAKYYSAELSQKVKRGLFESLEKGNTLGSFTIYGYEVVNKKFVINQVESVIVNNIYSDYAKGMTAKDIVSKLNNAKILNKRGRPFVINSIMNMLKNEKYNGTLYYGEYIKKDYLPKIIEDNLFKLVQERIKNNRRSPARMKAQIPYLLSGKLFCGECKSLMTGESGTGNKGVVYNYYKCFGKKKHNECKKKSVPKNYIENLVLDLTLKHILNEDNYCPIVDKVVTVFNSELEKSSFTKAIKAELMQTEKGIDNLLKAIKMGIFTESTKTELISLEQRQIELEEKLATQITLEAQPLNKDKIIFWFKSFKNIEDDLKKSVIIEAFVKKVVLYDKRLIILYNHTGNNKSEYNESELEEILKEPHSNLAQPSPPLANNTNPEKSEFVFLF